jgi:hypothetical protein
VIASKRLGAERIILLGSQPRSGSRSGSRLAWDRREET